MALKPHWVGHFQAWKCQGAEGEKKKKGKKGKDKKEPKTESKLCVNKGMF